MVLGLTLLVVFLVRQPILLIGGLIGMALVGAGGWWLATEQNPRRAIRVVIALVGALAIVWSVLRAFSDNYAGLWRLLVVLAVLGLAIAAARARSFGNCMRSTNYARTREAQAPRADLQSEVRRRQGRNSD